MIDVAHTPVSADHAGSFDVVAVGQGFDLHLVRLRDRWCGGEQAAPYALRATWFYSRGRMRQHVGAA